MRRWSSWTRWLPKRREAATDPAGWVELDQLRIEDPDGSPVSLSDYVFRPTVVVLVRYYG